ncbi:MAG: hypothetical protein OER86_07820 [Phycisphaerae bacterium]|nr:hypothetical protein [Phycisphaerae bacterium]
MNEPSNNAWELGYLAGKKAGRDPLRAISFFLLSIAALIAAVAYFISVFAEPTDPFDKIGPWERELTHSPEMRDFVERQMKMTRSSEPGKVMEVYLNMLQTPEFRKLMEKQIELMGEKR